MAESFPQICRKIEDKDVLISFLKVRPIFTKRNVTLNSRDAAENFGLMSNHLNWIKHSERPEPTTFYSHDSSCNERAGGGGARVTERS